MKKHGLVQFWVIDFMKSAASINCCVIMADIIGVGDNGGCFVCLKRKRIIRIEFVARTYSDGEFRTARIYQGIFLHGRCIARAKTGL